MRLQIFIRLKYYNAQKWESAFRYNIIFETYQPLEPPSSNSGGERRVQQLTFLNKFNVQQLLFEAFLNVTRIFGSIEP